MRPTSDRTRQAIFNMLRHKDFGIGFALEGAAVLDLFAGTGALGIEALSQGARWCLLVDDSADSRALQRENVEALGLTGATRIWRRDATDLGPLGPSAGGPFNLVFLDPPYRKEPDPQGAGEPEGRRLAGGQGAAGGGDRRRRDRWTRPASPCWTNATMARRGCGF